MPPQGGGMQFENQGEEFGRPPESSGFDLTGTLVNWGLVSTRQEAQYVMVAVVVLAFLVVGFLFMRLFSGAGAPPPPPVDNSGINTGRF